MSSTGHLAFQSLQKNRNMAIMFSFLFGLRGGDFLTQLWSTGSLSAASADWVTHRLPSVPASLLIFVVVFAILIGVDVAQESVKDTYSDRTDGYRATNND